MAVTDKIKEVSTNTYKVKDTVSLSNLAKKFGVTEEQLIAANPGWAKNERVLTKAGGSFVQAGANLLIPSGAGNAITGDTEEDLFEGKSYDKDTFKQILGVLLGFQESEYSGILDEIWNAYNTKYKTQAVDLDLIPELIAGSADTPLFNKEFQAYLDIRKNKDNVTGITSLKDFIDARKSYKELMNYYGLKGMATNESVDKFISGNVSVVEAQARMQTAYDAVMTADPILKSQLGSLNLSDQDLVKALLLGPDGRQELENKIKTANISAAEVEAGIKSSIGARELALQGITREQARAGLSTVKQSVGGYTSAAQRALQDASGIQKELEQEQLLGLKSKRRAKLGVREQGLMSGQSGMGQTSLMKQSSGKFQPEGRMV